MTARSTPAPASNVSGLYEDERALWEFIDHGKSPASNAAKGLDLPRCVVDHDHEADEGPCVYSVPASNVSEGLREAIEALPRFTPTGAASGAAMRRHALGGYLAYSQVRAALAHAAPEGLDVNALYARRERTADAIAVHVGSMRAHDIVDDVIAAYEGTQPDATEEAGR